MKGFIFSLFILLTIISLVTVIVWDNWWYPNKYESSLRLADDASLPQQKADYLKEYLETVSTIKHKPAYIFMRRDMELDRQRELLKGLIQRFEDVAKIPPSEMAYQQGMEQLTGQEMDHQLDRISSLFCSAKFRESKMFLLGMLSIGFSLIMIIAGIVWFSEI